MNRHQRSALLRAQGQLNSAFEENVKLNKALLYAAKLIETLSGTCPLDFDNDDWARCPAHTDPNACPPVEEASECWLSYILEKSEENE